MCARFPRFFHVSIFDGACLCNGNFQPPIRFAAVTSHSSAIFSSSYHRHRHWWLKVVTHRRCFSSITRGKHSSTNLLHPENLPIKTEFFPRSLPRKMVWHSWCAYDAHLRGTFVHTQKKWWPISPVGKKNNSSRSRVRCIRSPESSQKQRKHCQQQHRWWHAAQKLAMAEQQQQQLLLLHLP